jgi:hypothetical protein
MRFAARSSLPSLAALAACAALVVVGDLACSKRASEASLEAGPAAPTTGPLAHPCSLLLRADVEPILGSDLSQTEDPAGATTDARCLWSVSGGRGFVELHLQNPPQGLVAFRKAGGAERKPLPGLGEAAYSQTQGQGGRVDVYKNGLTFFVHVLPHERAPTSAPPLDQAGNIARAVAGRL